MIRKGDLVIIDKIAFEYAGYDFDSKKTGIVVSSQPAREFFNLDTDDLMCEVMITSGDVCVFYEEDLMLIEK